MCVLGTPTGVLDTPTGVLDTPTRVLDMIKTLFNTKTPTARGAPLRGVAGRAGQWLQARPERLQRPASDSDPTQPPGVSSLSAV